MERQQRVRGALSVARGAWRENLEFGFFKIWSLSVSCRTSFVFYYLWFENLKRRAPIAGSNRVLRGGCWNNNAQNCRSANRNNNTPDNRNHNIGFRLVFVP